MEMNAVATFNLCRLAAAAMAENEPDEDGQRGVIVNTASIAGFEGQTGQITYATAKAAILGMTLPLARDLSAVGIRVCAIAPGTMGTPKMLGVSDAVREKLVENIERLGTGNLLGLFQLGTLPADLTRRNLELFATEVMPRLKARFPEGEPILRQLSQAQV